MSKQLHEGRDEILKNPDANDNGQGIRNKPSKAAQGSNCRRCKHDEVAYLLLSWRNITISPTIIHWASPGVWGSQKVFLLGGLKSAIPVIQNQQFT